MKNRKTVHHYMRTLYLYSIAVAGLSAVAMPLQAVDNFDSSFGQSLGYVATAYAQGFQINAVKIQSDGNIVVGGYAQNPNQQAVVARYNNDGTLDTSFGTDGIVTTNIGSTDSTTIINDLALQTDGSIVVVGYVIDGGSSECFIARYTSSGTLDGTFGSGGVVVSTFGGDGGQFNGIVIQTDGNIVAAGVGSFSGSPNGLLVRFTTAGLLDTTFGGTGFVTLANGTSTSFMDVALDSSGRIVVSGTNQAGFGPQAITARYTSVGALDATFGTSGIITTQIGSNTSITSLALDSSGNILVAGSATVSGDTQFVIIRYTSAGVVDSTFGSGGSVTTAINDGASIESIAIQSDGKIIVAGHGSSSIDIAAAVRYTSAGVLDTTFGNEGIVLLNLGEGTRFNGLALQSSDGRAVVGGFEFDPETGFQVGLVARLNKNNTDFVNITSITTSSITTKIPTISGTSSEASAQVRVTINGTVFTTVSTNGSGNWNAGVSSVLLVGSNLIQADLIVGGDVVVSDEINVTVIDNLGEDAVFAYDTTTQSLTGSFADISFNTHGQISTWSHTLGTASFTCNKAGTYDIRYIGTAQSTSTLGSFSASMRLVKNGVAIAGSQFNQALSLSGLTLIGTNSILSPHTSIIAVLAAGDVIKVQALGSNAQLAPAGSGTFSPSGVLMIARIV